MQLATFKYEQSYTEHACILMRALHASRLIANGVVSIIKQAHAFQRNDNIIL